MKKPKPQTIARRILKGKRVTKGVIKVSSKEYKDLAKALNALCDPDPLGLL